MNNLFDSAKAFFRKMEGWEPRCYLDSLGFWTIGCGRNIHPGTKDHPKGPGLRDCEISFMLQNDIDEAIRDLRNAIDFLEQLSPARQIVLMSMRHQLGLEGLLDFQPTLQHMQAGQFDEAASHLLASRAASQTPERWKVQAEMMRTGEMPS